MNYCNQLTIDFPLILQGYINLSHLLAHIACDPVLAGHLCTLTERESKIAKNVAKEITLLTCTSILVTYSTLKVMVLKLKC